MLLHVSCSAGVVTGSPLTFVAPAATQNFGFTAPSSTQTVTCSYTLSGNDAAHWVKPADTTFAIILWSRSPSLACPRA